MSLRWTNKPGSQLARNSALGIGGLPGVVEEKVHFLLSQRGAGWKAAPRPGIADADSVLDEHMPPGRPTSERVSPTLASARFKP